MTPPVNLKMTFALLLLSPSGCSNCATSSSVAVSNSASGRGHNSRKANKSGRACARETNQTIRSA